MHVMAPAEPDLDHLLRLVARMVSERYGVIVPKYRLPVLRAAFEQIDEHDSRSGLNRLAQGDEASWAQLITATTVCETYLFRHRGHFDLIRDHARALITAGRDCTVLSAGCSTGEEVWSTAAILASLPSPGLSRCRAEGWELSKNRLQHACAGRYSRWACRAGFNGYDRFFHQRGEAWEVDVALRSHVHFEQVNLTDGELPDRSFDIILFRNVSIYWDQETTDRVSRALAALLQPDGLLLPGPSDPIDLPADRWVQEFHDGGGRLFRRRRPEERSARKESRTDTTDRSARITTGSAAASRPRPPQESIEPRRSIAARPAAAASAESTPAEPMVAAGSTATESIIDEVRLLADTGAYKPALALLDRDNNDQTPDRLLWKGILLLNLGREEEAVTSLRRCVFLEPEEAAYRRWLAVAFDACGQETDAAREHRNAAQLE